MSDAPDVAALREALDAIREEYESEDVPAVKAGLGIAFDAVRVVLNQHVIPPDLCPTCRETLPCLTCGAGL